MPGKLTTTLRRVAGGSSGSLAANLRRKRFEHTRQLLDRVPKPYLILDVGGTQRFWETVGMCGEPGVEMVLLNLNPAEATGPGMSTVVGTATDMPEFGDKQFDLVFSNSVIEHVGGPADQRAMADEVRRIGRRWVLQTPCRWFPIEPHFLFPYFNFLPLAAQAFLLQHLRLGWAKRPIADH
ncbi:MAG: hypothetical protein QOE62_422, partial [Actinomycetota bacterium]|nr:hypothetical protein [Actinomycetota bacterium]